MSENATRPWPGPTPSTEEMARTASKKRVEPPSESEEASDRSDEQQSEEEARPSKGKKKAAAVEKSASKTKGRGKRAVDNDSEQESDDEGQQEPRSAGHDEQGATNARSQGEKGKKGGKPGLTDDESRKLTADIARYALFCESTRKLFKREDLTKTLLADGKARYFPELLPRVQKLLKDTFGMELVLLRSRETTAKNPPKAYIVRSTLSYELLQFCCLKDEELRHAKSARDISSQPPSGSHPALHAQHDWALEDGCMRSIKREEGPAYGILATILALILVNGKQLHDDQLVSYMKRLEVFPNTEIPASAASGSHTLSLIPYLQLLVKQGYLERIKPQGVQGAGGATQHATQPKKQRLADDGGDPAVAWKWGGRAEAEIGEMGIAKFIQAVYAAKRLDPDSDESGDDDDEVATASEQRRNKKGGDTGEKLISEIGRAAGEGTLAEARVVKGLGL